MIFGQPFNVPLSEFAVIAMFGLTFSIASVTLAEGVRRIPAGEAALLGVLETPLASIMGWLIFAEVPTNASLIGGGLVLAAIIATQISIN